MHYRGGRWVQVFSLAVTLGSEGLGFQRNMMSGGQVKTMSESLNSISPWPPLPRQRSVGTLELRELRYFQSVARTGNFGRAARELNVGQPNVSHQVRKLEEEL